MKAKDLYNVAVYLRLSKDDGEAGKAEKLEMERMTKED